MHRLFATVAGLSVRWVWSPVIVQADGADSALAAMYPGDGYVDYLGVTGYEHEAGNAAATFVPTMTALRRLSTKPVVLAEIGVDGPAKTHWLATLGPYVAANPDIAGLIYFDTTPTSTGATGDYALTTAADRAAFAQSITALHTPAARPS